MNTYYLPVPPEVSVEDFLVRVPPTRTILCFRHLLGAWWYAAFAESPVSFFVVRGVAFSSVSSEPSLTADGGVWAATRVPFGGARVHDHRVVAKVDDQFMREDIHRKLALLRVKLAVSFNFDTGQEELWLHPPVDPVYSNLWRIHSDREEIWPGSVRVGWVSSTGGLSWAPWAENLKSVLERWYEENKACSVDA